MSKCLICCAPNNGLHFGINCCRPCSAFFRRSIQLKLTYKCQKHGRCDISLTNRYSCRFCRLKKCYGVGMGEQAASIRNKSALLSRDGSIESDPRSSDHVSSSSEKRHFSFNVETAKEKINDVFKKKSSSANSSSIPLGICQQALIAYKKLSERWPNCTKEKVTYSFEFDIVKHVDVSYSQLEYIAEFCTSIKHFSELPLSVKWILFKNFWTKFYEIERIYTTCQLLGHDREEYLYVTFEGIAINMFKTHIPDFENILNTSVEGLGNLMGPTMVKVKRQFVDPYKAYQPDLFEVMYIIMNCLWTLPVDSEVDPASEEAILTVKEHLAEELYSYYLLEKREKNYASRIYKLQSLIIGLDEVAAIRKEDGFVNALFKVFKEDFYLNDLK